MRISWTLTLTWKRKRFKVSYTWNLEVDTEGKVRGPKGPLTAHAIKFAEFFNSFSGLNAPGCNICRVAKIAALKIALLLRPDRLAVDLHTEVVAVDRPRQRPIRIFLGKRLRGIKSDQGFGDAGGPGLSE